MASYLRGSARPLTQRYDVALLDLDGVVYIGSEPVSGAPQALSAARAAGMRLAFVTNNASRPPRDVAEHLVELGIEATRDEVITSAQAGARYLADRLAPGAHVLVVGTTGLVEALREEGLEPVERADGPVDAVIQGFSPEMTWRLLAEGALAISRGAPWVATNLDPTVPSRRGRLPGNGALVAALRTATGVEPTVTGKPDPTMHQESVRRSGARQPIVVGDRLDTDIEGANAVGCDSLLVMSGVTSPSELLAASRDQRPTYIAMDLNGLLDAHPEPRVRDGAAECRGWRARCTKLDGNLGNADLTLTVDQAVADARAERPNASAAPTDEADLDALRALCFALWERLGSDIGVVHVEPGGDAAARAAAAEAITRLGLNRG